MKTIVLTKETQGQRENDFFWGVEGELAYFGFECDTDKRNIDGGCGCRRSFSGLRTTKASTTAEVKNVLTPEWLWKWRYRRHLRKGWNMTDRFAIMDATDEQFERVKKIADKYPVGTILEKRGKTIKERKKDD